MQRLVAHFGGLVQGVGFRYTAVWESRDFQVTGYVKNLADGRVELVAEGNRAELLKFLERMKARFGRHVRTLEHTFQPALGEFHGFGIRY